MAKAYKYESGFEAPVVGRAFGFDINAKAPGDARTTVDTLAQRNAIKFTYEGLEVYVTSLKKKYRCNTDAVPAGTPSQDQHWTVITEGGSVAAQFKGIWKAATAEFPGLVIPAAELAPNDYFIVDSDGLSDVVKSFNTGSPAESVVSGDEIIWLGTRWGIVRSINRASAAHSHTHLDITDWNAQTAIENAQKSILKYNEDASYLSGQVVYNRTYEGPISLGDGGGVPQESESGPRDTRNYPVRIYKAKRDIVAADSLTDKNAWELIASTAYSDLANAPQIDNSRGLKANIPFPQDNGAGYLLDAKEIDRRIGERVSQAAGGNIHGGYSYTPEADMPSPMFP